MPTTDSALWQYKDPILQTWPDSGHVVVFDLEYTAWEGSRERSWSGDWEHREIVQIGAVLVDAAAGFEQIDSFNRFIKPIRNPLLSNYFTALTGIDQTTVDNEGTLFVEAYSEFVQFVGDVEVLFANGTDGEVLRENCKLNNMGYVFERGRIINIRSKIASEVSERVGQKYNFIDSCDLIDVLGCSTSTDDSGHNALADAKKIVFALRELRRHSAI